MDSVSTLLVSNATSGNSQQRLCVWERGAGESRRTEGTQKQKLYNSLYLIYEIKTLLMKKVHRIHSVFAFSHDLKNGCYCLIIIPEASYATGVDKSCALDIRGDFLFVFLEFKLLTKN